MKTTLNMIRACSPCESGWKKLLKTLGKTSPDNEPLSIITILDSNGLDDALWCLRAVKGCDSEIRLYAVWCARQVQHLMGDPRSTAALDVAERYANGFATNIDLAAARVAAGVAVRADPRNAAGALAWGATCRGDALAAEDTAWRARDAAGVAAWAAAGDAAGVAARAAARAAQEKRLREICAEIEARTQGVSHEQ